jgi:nitrate/nitrite-specific signal transduction histidine kinase
MPSGIRWGGLRTKIIAWSFVPTAIILAAVAWVTFTAYQQVTEDLVIERDRELTRFSAGEFAAGLTEHTALLTEYAGLLGILPHVAYAYEGDLAVQSDVLQQASARFQVFDGGVLTLSKQGVVVATEPERPEILGQDWSNRTYFRDMLRSPGPVFSDIVADGPRGAEVIVVAVPIRGHQGQFSGIMAGLFRVGAGATSPLYRAVAGLGVGQSGSAYLVDGSGRVIYHSDPDRIGDDFSTHVIVQEMLGGKMGALRTRDIDGRQIVASFAPVPGTSWGLVSEATWDALTSGSRGYQRFLLLLLVLGVAVPALVVAVGITRITRPITELIGAAQEVAAGKFGQEISASTGDEVEELAKQFTIMSSQLQESYAHLEQRVADRTKELAALNAIATVVSRSLDLEEILNDALDKMLEVMEIEAGGVYLLDEETEMLGVATYRGFDPQFVAEIDKLKVGEGFSGRVADSGQPLVVKDVSLDPRLTRTAVREERLHSLASVPLRSRGKVLGTLFAVTRGYREFTDQDVQLLTSIGHQIGVAIENAHLFEAEQRRAEQFRVISEVGRRITSILDIDEVLVQVARLIHQTFDYYHVGIAVREEDQVVYKVGAGELWDDPQFQFQPARLKVGQEGVAGWVAAMGEPLLVPDVSQDPRYVWMRGSKTRSELAVPIEVKGEIVGVLDVQSDRLNAFDESDLVVLQSLAHQTAIAVQNAQLYEQAQQGAVLEERQRLARELHDAVTQMLFSASLIAETLPALWESDQEKGRQLLQELRQLSRGALAEMRTLLLELRPTVLVEANLGDLLHQLAEVVTGRTGVPVTVMAEGESELPSDVHVALYRIAQEALNNVIKHARASHVAVDLRCALHPSSLQEEWMKEGNVELCIIDDGCGFDPSYVPAGRLGLGIMRERAQAVGATLEIDSQLGNGTRVTAVWKG